jgi:predicted nucleic acid-binding protein
MTRAVYDAGALVAADRNDREFWLDHRVRLEQGIVPVVSAAVVAQVSRSTRQVSLRRLLKGCDVVVLDEDVAHRAGRLLGAAGTADVVDATVAVVAADLGAVVYTGDRGDIECLLASTGSAAVVKDV